MKKKLFVSLITVIMSFSFFTGIAVKSVPAGAAALSRCDVEENFDGYADALYTQANSAATIGDWQIFWANENASVQLMDDPTGEGMGKVLRLNNSSLSGNSGNGTYLHVMYNATGDNAYTARNFTVSYDFYKANGMDSSWQGLYARDKDPSYNMIGANTLVFTFQNGKGTSGDVINLSDGGTRAGTKSDYCFQYSPIYSYGTGTSSMRPESGSSENFGRFFNVDGGNIKGVWLSVKIQVRGKYFSAYMKCKDSQDWFYMGTAYLADKDNRIDSGAIGLGTCGGDFYFDNFKIQNEDETVVSATSVADEEYGRAYAVTETAGADTDVELYTELSDGYVYGGWYKDSACETPVTVKDLKLQRYKYNDSYGVWEWADISEDEVSFPTKTFGDLDEIIISDGQSLTVREYYSGSKYRLVTTVNTKENGFEYYASIDKRTYYVAVEVDGEGSVSGDYLENEGSGLLGKIAAGRQITLTATPSSGEIFAGWYKTLTLDGESYRQRISRDGRYDYTVELGGINVQAVFVSSDSAEYSVTINSSIVDSESEDYGKIVAGAGQFYDGEEVSLIAEENTGFSFVKWVCDGETLSTEKYFNLNIQSNMAIEAVFEVEKYMVFVSDGLGSESTRIVSANSEVKLVAPVAPEGFSFSGWLVTGIDDYEQDRVTRSVTFTASEKSIYAKAQYVENTHNVRVTTDNKKGTALGSGNYRTGATVTIRVMPKDGYSAAQYIVRGVDVTLNSDGSCSFVMPDNDVIIRIEYTTTDTINVHNAIVALVVFGIIILIIVAALLFVNKGDGDGGRGGRAGKRETKRLRAEFAAQSASTATAKTEDEGGLEKKDKTEKR